VTPSSLRNGNVGGRRFTACAALAPWPVPEPAHWLRHVNAAQSEAELAAVRRSVTRGMPYGSEGWTRRTAARLGLEYTLRQRGRPKKERPQK
jgi:REP-associated tyrosine transposase